MSSGQRSPVAWTRREATINRRVLLITVMLLVSACSRPAPAPGPKLNAVPITLEPSSSPIEDGSYLLEPATGKVWRLSPSPFARVTWSRDGGTLLINQEPVHNRYEADVIDMPKGTGIRLSGSSGENLHGAALSPDGKQFAFYNPRTGSR